MISHLKWMGHSATIFEIQKSLREDLETCEVTLVTRDCSVRAHRFVLSSCSDLLRNLLVEVPLGHEATIIVPDIKGTLLDNVLTFIYMGEAQISSTNLSDFLEAINILGIKSAISFECSTLARQCHSASTPLKAIAGLQIIQDDAIEPDNGSITKIHSENIAPQEYLEMYGGTQPKVHYALEQVSNTNQGSEFILTENSGEYTLTQNTKVGATESKLNTVDGEDLETEVDADVEADEGSIVEDLASNADENIIEMTTENTANTNETPLRAMIDISEVADTDHIIENRIDSRQLKTKEPIHNHHHDPERHTHKLAPVYETNELVEQKDFRIYQQPLAVEISLSSKAESTADPLELAVLSVINDGMSLQKAAQKHEISKTVLWRRVRKDPNYQKTARENPVLAAACERLKHGESMKNISKELEIPMSTLHRHKVRLSLQGRLPKWVTFKKRDANSKDELREKLNKAVHACVHDGMSQNHAANLFDIPKSTLWRHLQKRMAEAEAMVSEGIKEEVILS